MAVSVTTRPNTWSAVKNPVTYKFTTSGGPFTNYRIEVEVFKASDDSSLTGGIKFSFSPNASGITYADVSTIIKAYLKAEWAGSPADLNEAETDTSLEFYIKYQELYDGSAVGVVDDVANPRYAVFGGLQIPSSVGNSLTNYVPASGSSVKKFLTIFQNPKMWRGYPLTLSFIHPDASGLWVDRKQYDRSGSLLSESLRELDAGEDDAVNRMNLIDAFFTLNALAKTLKVRLAAKAQLLSDPSFDGGGIGGDWSNLADETPNNPWVNSGGIAIGVSLDDPGTPVLYSQVAFQTLADTYPPGNYVVRINGSQSGSGITRTVIKLYMGGVEHSIPAYDNDTAYAGAADFDLAFEAFDPFDGIGLQVRRVVGVDTRTIFFHRADLFQTVNAGEELTFAIEDACKNPVLLFWKNSLGGDAWWLFDVDQELSYNLSGQKKAKRLTLFANNLTADQWEALNELTHLGEVYKENIVEFTSSINKSHVRDGAQAYVVDASGNKTGVVVIPKANVMFTRMVRHRFEIEIEFPERYE